MHFISYLLWSLGSFSVAELVCAFILFNESLPDGWIYLDFPSLTMASFTCSLDVMLSIKATKCKLFLNYLTVSCPISLKIHKSGCN